MNQVTPFNPRPVALPGDLSTLCRQYLAHLTARGYSLNTLNAYRVDLEQFVGYLAGQDVCLVQLVATRHVDGFIDALLGGAMVRRRTAARKLESVKGLFRFAVARGLIADAAHPCRHAAPVRFQSEPPVAPEVVQLVRMVGAIPTDCPENVRDRALFRLMLDAGLRVGGLLSLDVYDPMDPPRCGIYPGGVVRYANKGGAVGEGVCSEVSLAYVAAWEEQRTGITKGEPEPALFISRQGRRLTRQAVLLRLRRHAEAAGLPRLHNHLLRHARAAQVIEQAGLHTAQYMLNHKRLSTTADQYGAVAKSKLRERIRRECPLVEDEQYQEVA